MATDKTELAPIEDRFEEVTLATVLAERQAAAAESETAAPSKRLADSVPAVDAAQPAKALAETVAERSGEGSTTEQNGDVELAL